MVPYSTLRDFARKLRAPKAVADEEARFETAPAHQAQCDWADCNRITERGAQQSHAEAFAFFGGVPYSILYDNPKTITTGRNERSEPIWNRDFADFAARYGFRPTCARPYRAKTKGKVERTIGFLRTSFFPGRSFSDVDDAQRQLNEWLEEANLRVHRTHGEVVNARFGREAELLLPLRAGMSIVSRTEQRIVDAEGFISYGSNRYEMPRGQRGRTLLVHDNGTVLRFYDEDLLVCEHQRLHGKRRTALRRAEKSSITALLNITVERRPLAEYDEAAT